MAVGSAILGLRREFGGGERDVRVGTCLTQGGLFHKAVLSSSSALLRSWETAILKQVGLQGRCGPSAGGRWLPGSPGVASAQDPFKMTRESVTAPRFSETSGC